MGSPSEDLASSVDGARSVEEGVGKIWEAIKTGLKNKGLDPAKVDEVVFDLSQQNNILARALVNNTDVAPRGGGGPASPQERETAAQPAVGRPTGFVPSTAESATSPNSPLPTNPPAGGPQTGKSPVGASNPVGKMVVPNQPPPTTGNPVPVTGQTHPKP